MSLKTLFLHFRDMCKLDYGTHVEFDDVEDVVVLVLDRNRNGEFSVRYITGTTVLKL